MLNTTKSLDLTRRFRFPLAKYHRTAQFPWALFFSWMLLLTLGRIVTEVLLFDQNTDIPIRSSPRAFKENEFLIRDTSVRRRKTSTQKAPLQPQWSNTSADLGESACESDDLFQYDNAFVSIPADQDSMRESVQNAKDCCKLCELRELCTHWTFEASRARCVIMNASPHPIDTIDLPGAVSARASLNKYIARRHDSSIPRPEHRGPIKCVYDEDDRPFLDASKNKSAKTTGGNISLTDGYISSGVARDLSQPITRYIVLNEARSGSSWLQEISQMHPGIKVQFELDLPAGDAALACQQCGRPWSPDSKRARLVPPRRHPPQACGFTAFGSANRFSDVAALARRTGARLVVLLRRDHLAQAVSSYLHFHRDYFGPDVAQPVPWRAAELRRAVAENRQAYERLLRFPAECGRPAHLIFFEDLRARPAAVWRRLQAFLGLPAVAVADMDGLERRSTSKPAPQYLMYLDDLRRELNGTALGRALADDGGGGGDLGGEFAQVCARHGGGAALSWRGGVCAGGEAVPWGDADAADGDWGAPSE